MTKMILEFELPEQQSAAELALRSQCLQAFISSVRDTIFRPARKHGYSDKSIQVLIDQLGPNALILIERLELKWGELVEQYEIREFQE